MYIYVYMLIKTEYTVIFNLNTFRQQSQLYNFTCLHVYLATTRAQRWSLAIEIDRT